jgi:hypothetical protein
VVSNTGELARGATVEVVLRRFPLRLAARATEHYEGLLREFALMAASTSMDEDAVPARLISLVDALGRQFPRQDAHEAGRRLDRMFDEAEEFCRSGDLLTLAAEPDVVEFRRWYLDEMSRQAEGAQPNPWPGELE